MQRKIFNEIGDDVRLPFIRLSLYPKMVIFHNNIEVVSGVQFITHDAIHYVLNNLTGKEGGIAIRKKHLVLRYMTMYLL